MQYYYTFFVCIINGNSTQTLLFININIDIVLFRKYYAVIF